MKTTSHIYKGIEFQNDIQRTQHHNVFKSCFYWRRDKYTKPVSDLDIFKDCALGDRVNLNFTEIFKADTLR